MKNLKICCDIDGVLAESLPTLLFIVNKNCGIKIKASEVTEFVFHRKYQITDKQFQNCIEEFNTHYLQMLPTIVGARRVLYNLSSEHSKNILTCRTNRGTTETWLKTQCFFYKDLILCGTGEDKVDYCKINKADLLIDDCGDTCLLANKAKIPSVLYNAPYNRYVEGEYITRCKNWQQIADHIKKVSEGTGI